MNGTEPDEFDIPDWPADWPGRQLVDLDNVGDPGCWLEVMLPDPADLLLGDPEEDQQNAKELATAYISRLEELGFSLSTDFEMSEKAMHEAFATEFVGFLREWRKRAIGSRVAWQKGSRDNPR